MVAPPYTAEPGDWFLRGVQSAVFYYVSCTPWVEHKRKRKRRREAQERAQERGEVVTTQPGTLKQPAPFQTNEAWAEELLLGPGPPKGWKKDGLLQQLQNKAYAASRESNLASASPETTESNLDSAEPAVGPSTQSTDRLAPSSTRPSPTSNGSEDRSPGTEKSPPRPARPPLERRWSTAVDNLKESLRVSLHPPKWNWKRYDREDEILAGFTERMTRMWNRATSGKLHEDVGSKSDEGEPSTYRRKRAATNESERYDYNRARHPEVNELSPPIVSQLPATRAEAAWMLLPPPSAAVMEARIRPTAEPEMRWPLCVIGRPPKETESKQSLAKTRSRYPVDTRDFGLGHSTGIEAEDNFLKGPDDSSEDEKALDDPVLAEIQNSSRIKHLSDPINRRPLVHPVSRIAGDLFVPKRRDSWQFHCVVPPNQPAES